MSTVKTAIGRFVWHDHVSGDPDKARSFYSDLLGWETEIFEAGEIAYPMIKVNETTHGGFGPAQGGAPPHWLGHVGVEDVDETVAQAEGAGGSLLAAPMDIPEVGRMAVLRDPQGAAFSVFSSASQEWTPTEGVFVWDELHTTDVDGATAFYREVIGWSANDRDMGGGVTYTMFDSGGEQRAGCMTIMQPDMPPNWLTYIGSDDVDASCKRAEELGARKMMGPMDIPGVGRSAVLTDPTGAVFALFSPSES
jgi:predicted enzyme related to lactoylglutathione lyase